MRLERLMDSNTGALGRITDIFNRSYFIACWSDRDVSLSDPEEVLRACRVQEKLQEKAYLEQFLAQVGHQSAHALLTRSAVDGLGQRADCAKGLMRCCPGCVTGGAGPEAAGGEAGAGEQPGGGRGQGPLRLHRQARGGEEEEAMGSAKGLWWC